MTLQSSGPISLGNVNTELGRSATATISLGETAVRTLAGVPTGPISLSNLYGKSNAPPVTFTPPGGTSPLDRWYAESIDLFYAEVTLSCSVPALWVWTQSGSGSGYASIGNGATASSVTFAIGSSNGGGGTQSETFTVQGTANGVTRYYTVFVEAQTTD